MDKDMKTALFSLLAAAALFAACDDDDGIRVDPVIDDAFRALYPGASRVEWNHRGDYYVADFDHRAADAEAWFDRRGTWHMTETDIRYRDLPAAVRAAFEGGEYAAWRVDDVDMLDYSDRETVYVIEVESGKAESDLYYTADGVLGKVVPEHQGGSAGGYPPGTGDNNGNGVGNGNVGGHTPQGVLPAVKSFIDGKYPGARIVDVEREHGSIEIDIVDGVKRREVVFTAAGEWTRTETELRVTELPDVVINALRASRYGTWRVDDVDHHDTPTGEYYLFELESSRRETHLKIDPAGNVLQP